jgi:hypothetical protein
MTTTHTAPPGWYPDPEGQGLRYFDGAQWTEYRSGVHQMPPRSAQAGQWQGGPPPVVGPTDSQVRPPKKSNSVEYEFKSVKALRGRESSARARWQNQGWEFVSENRGTLRTELNFRRVKPKTFGAYVLNYVAAVRRWKPKTQLVLVASAALILAAGILGIVVATQSGGDTHNPSATQTTASTASKPSETPSETSEPDATKSSEPNDAQVLTADNSEELAALLAVPDYCDETIAPFVAKYAGRTIEFDGSVVSMANHGDYDTRYDILVAPGNKGPESTIGPGFKFEDVNVFDLKLTGSGASNYVSEGDRFRFVAQVVEYNPETCLLFLEPVSTRVR